MTPLDPDGEVERILDSFFVAGTVDGGWIITPEMIEKAKSRLTRMLLEARLDEIERARKVNVWWKEYARERINQLKGRHNEE